MATKRSHQTYASDSVPPPTYTTYGTPLPPSPSARDDGTYLPLWKQDVRDEHGRKRLHGAFTGGWSAGYFNTVGSKEGWTPSTFVSSRSDRRKDDKKKNEGMRVEDFMDEEDLADHSEAQKLQTSEAFAGLGDGGREDGGGLTGLFHAKGDTMGSKLLRRMGWNDGQGIGPKIRRGARLDTKSNGGESGDQTYMFAPDNAPMINFTRKTDRKGLGHLGEAKLSSTPTPKNTHNQDEDDTRAEQSKFSVAPPQQKKPPRRTGIGVGILNEDGSDEEDPYEVGPKISYNRIMGGDKKKKKKAKAKENVAVNPSLGTAPVFLTKSARGLRRSHDGRLPLDGFILAKVTEDFSTLLSAYTPPPVPEGWVSSKQRESSSSDIPYTSTTDAAKNSTLDPKSRASLLGEAPLPGKSVFDFLSSSTRDRLAAASGKGHLPQGKGEIPEEYRLTAEEKHVKLWQEVAKVDKATAIAALGRTNGGPYADNEAKRERYRYFLSACAYPDSYPAPEKRKGGSEEDFIREMAEFHACAGLFKPLTGAAASRFASTTTILGAEPAAGLSKPVQPEKPSDPAMEAAKMGMFGKMTRMEETWFPSRLLCKRFNVKPPEHVQAGVDAEKEKSEMPGSAGNKFAPASNAQAGFGVGSGAESGVKEVSGLAALPLAPTQEKVDSERNDAVEAGAAHAEVLEAIFGDSDSE